MLHGATILGSSVVATFRRQRQQQAGGAPEQAGGAPELNATPAAELSAEAESAMEAEAAELEDLLAAAFALTPC